jgi:hypothetical protein
MWAIPRPRSFRVLAHNQGGKLLHGGKKGRVREKIPGPGDTFPIIQNMRRRVQAVFFPSASSMRASRVETDPLPLDPATWRHGQRDSGLPDGTRAGACGQA